MHKVRVFSLAVDFAAVANGEDNKPLVFDVKVKDNAVTTDTEAVGTQLRVGEVFGESERVGLGGVEVNFFDDSFAEG